MLVARVASHNYFETNEIPVHSFARKQHPNQINIVKEKRVSFSVSGSNQWQVVTCKFPMIRFKNVLLPAPFGPTTHTLETKMQAGENVYVIRRVRSEGVHWYVYTAHAHRTWTTGLCRS